MHAKMTGGSYQRTSKSENPRLGLLRQGQILFVGLAKSKTFDARVMNMHALSFSSSTIQRMQSVPNSTSRLSFTCKFEYQK
jgi:hypothetical protein